MKGPTPTKGGSTIRKMMMSWDNISIEVDVMKVIRNFPLQFFNDVFLKGTQTKGSKGRGSVVFSSFHYQFTSWDIWEIRRQTAATCDASLLWVSICPLQHASIQKNVTRSLFSDFNPRVWSLWKLREREIWNTREINNERERARKNWALSENLCRQLIWTRISVKSFAGRARLTTAVGIFLLSHPQPALY